MPAHPDLVAHSAEFARTVTEIAPGVWGFVGFAASNVYVIEGADTLAVIDTKESTGAAENILAEIRTRTSKPVETILYTHSHCDHISGATVFAEGGAPEIIAWHSFASDIVGDVTAPGAVLLDRTRKQFGFGLSFPDERVNLGLGPGNRPVAGMGAGHMAPMRLIDAPRSRKTLAAAEAADDPQWAMEVADRLIAVDEMTAQATRVKVAAMRDISDREINATARNFYLVSAADLESSL